MARVDIRSEVVEAGELELVPRAQLVQVLRALRENPQRGKPLVRELAGCRSIRIGGSENRLVYRYHVDSDVVEVLAVERRRASRAYEIAASRL